MQTERTAMDRDTVKDLRIRLEKKLNRADDAAEYNFPDNLVVSIGTASFNGHAVTFKIEIAEKSATGEVFNKDAEALKRYGHWFGLKPEALHTTFDFRGNKYEVIGLLPRSTKFPVLAKRIPDGKV